MFIPEELLTLTFLKLTPEGVRAASQTCKGWRKIINSGDFTAQYYLRSKPSSLLVVDRGHPEGCKTATIEFDPEEELGLESFKLKPDSTTKKTKSYTARSLCCGLILATDDNEDLFVVNMNTKHRVDLPKSASRCRHLYCWMTLLFFPDDKAYKIIHICSLYIVEILTIGISRNKWRVVPCRFLYISPRNPFLPCLGSRILTTDGQRSVHWRLHSEKRLLSMDVRSETFRHTLFPSEYESYCDRIMEIGDRLGIVHRGYRAQFEVSVLRDPVGGKWERLYKIEANQTTAAQSDLKLLQGVDDRRRPIFTLREGHVIIFENETNRWYIFYDAKLREMKRVFKLETTQEARLVFKLETTPDVRIVHYRER